VEAGGRRAPILQLELELKAGEPSALFRLAEALGAQAPLRLTFETKAEQGFRLAAGETPGAVKAVHPGLRRSMTVGQALALVAGAALRQIAANERMVRQFRRPEGVHQMRVGIRRLRSTLSLFTPPVPDPAYDHLRAELKWLGGQLGAARDVDVFITETFRPAAEALGPLPGLAAFGKRLKRAQTRAYDRLVKALDTPRARALPLAIAAWLEIALGHQPAAWRDAPVGAFAEASLDRLRRKVRKRADAKTAEARHALRIAAKKLRYGLDGFGGLYPQKPVGEYRRKVADLQGRLGALNDLATSQRVGLDALGGASPPEAAFAAGLVAGRRLNASEALITQAGADLKALLKAPRPWRT
jgi:inorganic triphosphatase YgiF